jgi:hypothetical protein
MTLRGSRAAAQPRASPDFIRIGGRAAKPLFPRTAIRLPGGAGVSEAYIQHIRREYPAYRTRIFGPHLPVQCLYEGCSLSGAYMSRIGRVNSAA